MLRRGTRTGAAAVAVVLAVATLGASDERSGSPAVIEVDHPVAPADRPVRLRITGLAPHEEVRVSSEARDHQGGRWSARAVFRADGHGAVDLGRARPRSGSYRGADAMGLFWSMNPPAGNGDDTRFAPFLPGVRPSYDVRITASARGRPVARRTLTRQWLTGGVTYRHLTVAADGAEGDLYLPPPGTARNSAVLLLGGSEGGNTMTYTAALLASRGHPALALCYFGCPGRPAALRDISLEYLASAARVLAARPGADPARVTAMGYSRGSEAALLLAEHYPGLIRGAVVYALSAYVHTGYPDSLAPAWTRNGRPVAQSMIPLGHVSGPVLAIAGADDELWAARSAAETIDRELADSPHPHRALIYPGAGHGVGTFPYLPSGTQAQGRPLGGTRTANEAAQAAGWQEVLAQLDRAPQGRGEPRDEPRTTGSARTTSAEGAWLRP